MTKELYFKQFGKMEKIPDQDKYVSVPNYAEAKKGNSCDLPIVNHPEATQKDVVTDYKGRKETSRKNVNIIALNGKFLSADETLEYNVVANRDKASSWENFTLVMFDNNECSIFTYKNLFFSTELHKKQEITAIREGIGAWEIFTLVDLGDDTVAFKAVNGKYLSLDKNGLHILAVADTINEQEKFKLIIK
jgi:hypothetical protein